MNSLTRRLASSLPATILGGQNILCEPLSVSASLLMAHVKWTGMTRFPQLFPPPPLHCFCAVLDDISPPLFCFHSPPTHLTATASQRLVSNTLLVTNDNSIQNFSCPSIKRGREGGTTTVKLMLKTILCLKSMVVTCNVMHTIKWTFFSSTTQILNLLCSKVHVPCKYNLL